MPESKRFFNQEFVKNTLISFGSVALAGYVGWISGYVDLKKDVAQHGKELQELKAEIISAKKDLIELKMSGTGADANLDKNISVLMERYSALEKAVDRLRLEEDAAHGRTPLNKR